MPREHPLLRTRRLVAEPLRAEDHELIRRMSQDEPAMTWIGGVRTEAEVLEGMAQALKQWEERGYGYYVVRDARTREPVGRAGLMDRELDGRRRTDLGYSFFVPHWGKGYATEIGAAILDFGFKKANLPEIVAFCAVENAASRRVLDKLRFSCEKEFEFKGERSVLYRALADDWQEIQSRSK